MGRATNYWRVEPEWDGETAFIIAGGPSVRDIDLSVLAGDRRGASLSASSRPQRVVVINSSYLAYPAADFLIFGDTRWWALHRKRLGDFSGRLVSTAESVPAPPVLKLRKIEPKPHAGLADDRQALAMRRTTLTAALNLCVYLGAVKIVLLGADMARAPDGASHHHPAHPWPVKQNCWDEQLVELDWAAQALARLKIDIVNCSPTSRAPWWRKASLPEVLRG